MLARNKLTLLASRINYHISAYFFYGSSANYTVIVYWEMCLSKPGQNQGTLSR